MEQSRLKALEEQCIQECAPPCTACCPVHVNVRQMVLAISKGNFEEGYSIFSKSTPFPEIIARTCSQPCKMDCNRKSKGGAIQIAELELACIKYGAQTNPVKNRLPEKNAHVAVVGGGLSGLTAALELARKGYRISLFEKERRLGGRLRDFPTEILPQETIERETCLDSQFGIEIHIGTTINTLSNLLAEFDAVYIGTGTCSGFGSELAFNPDGILQIDAAAFQTSHPKVFAGGSLLHPHSTILSISDGKRAAISIDRFLQKVSLTAARVNEGTYKTKLITSLEGVEPAEAVMPENPGTGFTQEEAAAEAARCLQCDCMECVKVCEYLRHYGSYPKKYVREIYNNLSIIMRTRHANKMINSCTLCGLCAEVCPTNLDMSEVIREARQTMVNTGKMPASAHDFALRDMAFSNSSQFAAIFLPDGNTTCSQMFFPGCQLAASNPEYLPRIYQTLLPAFPDMGIMLRCCGAPAEWSGENKLFDQALQEFKQQWMESGRPRLILACSSCSQMIKKSLPEIDTVSLWEILVQNNLIPRRPGTDRPFVIHDPCTSRHAPDWQDAARSVLTAMGIDNHELKMSRRMTECCGYGGAAWLVHPELVRDILQRRLAEDPADYLTYCAMCRDLFAGEGKATLHLLDLLYGENLELLSKRKGPDYSQRHENRIRAKRNLQKLILGKDQNQLESYEKYRLVMSAEMRSLLESRLILLEDIQKVIEHAETEREFFVDQENGHVLAYFKPNLITYWVEYSKTGDSYQVHDAYSHRMSFEEDAAR